MWPCICVYIYIYITSLETNETTTCAAEQSLMRCVLFDVTYVVEVILKPAHRFGCFASMKHVTKDGASQR